MLRCAPSQVLCFAKGMARVWENTADSDCRIFNTARTAPVL